MYQQMIREHAARMGRVRIDPRLVEAWMRVEHSTLDWMDLRRFHHEVEIGIACIDEAGVEQSEVIAKSIGL